MSFRNEGVPQPERWLATKGLAGVAVATSIIFIVHNETPFYILSAICIVLMVLGFMMWGRINKCHTNKSYANYMVKIQ